MTDTPQRTRPLRVLAAMSGGVDSAVAAARAAEAGHDVTGVHLALSANPQSFRTGARGCCTIEDSRDARRAADVIGIPFYVWDLADRFREDVVEDFVAEYEAGRTPNPCLRCNEKIKFAALLDKALALGFDAVCTGHYAKVILREDGTRELHRASDMAKDQSYVLGVLDDRQLAHALFPLGDTVTTKDEIRAEAERRGLAVAKKPDSHDICFIADGDTQGFLARRLGRAEGDIVDESGSKIGTHEGAYGFTIGQRKGLRIGTPAPDGKPRYVLDISRWTTPSPSARRPPWTSPRSPRSAPAGAAPPRQAPAPTPPSCAPRRRDRGDGRTGRRGAARALHRARARRRPRPGGRAVRRDARGGFGDHRLDGAGDGGRGLTRPAHAAVTVGGPRRGHRAGTVRRSPCEDDAALHRAKNSASTGASTSGSAMWVWPPGCGTRPGDRLGDRPRRLPHPRRARVARDRQHRHRDRRQQLPRHAPAAHHGVVVREARRHRLHAAPHRRLPRAPDHPVAQPGQPQEELHRVATAPSSRAAVSRSVYRARSARSSSDMAYGVSYTATWRTGSPLAAARSASAPPEETPYSAASPPTASISAARSSTSRSTAYGGVSPLAPRPRRS